MHDVTPLGHIDVNMNPHPKKSDADEGAGAQAPAPPAPPTNCRIKGMTFLAASSSSGGRCQLLVLVGRRHKENASFFSSRFVDFDCEMQCYEVADEVRGVEGTAGSIDSARAQNSHPPPGVDVQARRGSAKDSEMDASAGDWFSNDLRSFVGQWVGGSDRQKGKIRSHLQKHYCETVDDLLALGGMHIREMVPEVCLRQKLQAGISAYREGGGSSTTSPDVPGKRDGQRLKNVLSRLENALSRLEHLEK